MPNDALWYVPSEVPKRTEVSGTPLGAFPMAGQT